MVSYLDRKPYKGELRFVRTSYVDKDKNTILKEKSLLEMFDGDFWNQVRVEDNIAKVSKEDFEKYYNN